MNARTVVSTAAVISALGFVLGLAVGPQWIEELLHVEPDAGNGMLELLITIAPGVIAIAFGVTSRLLPRQTPSA
jgi:hypothetical protein